MSTASDAVVFGPGKYQFEVPSRPDCIGQGRIKAWPARAAVKFGFRAEQRQVTASAAIGSGAFLGVQRTAERRLGRFIAKDREGFLVQPRLPLFPGEAAPVIRRVCAGYRRSCCCRLRSRSVRCSQSCAQSGAERGQGQPPRQQAESGSSSDYRRVFHAFNNGAAGLLKQAGKH